MSVRLTDDMRRMIDEQRLGFVATVGSDGKPNLSPRGTLAVWDDEHLVFLDIRSPNTTANVRANPAIEVNVVDPFLRKGYRFSGTASVFAEGPMFDKIVAFYRQRGSKSPIRNVVLVKIEQARPLISPIYDQGKAEAEVDAQWTRHYDELRQRRRHS